MLHTALCDLLGIEYPIIQAGMSRFTSAELVAAVSNAGGLGSLGCDLRSITSLRNELSRIRELTDRPFAINHLLLSLSHEAFAITLRAKPPIISFAGGDPGDLVKLAHDAGALVMHQVQTVQQAVQAAERGVDVIVAQGSEAGGHSGTVAALALIPQIVDAVTPIPVVAAGGIADGRGLAAALVLGAQAINIGTRFLACVEAPVGQGWKNLIVGARSEDAVKFDAWSDISPMPGDHGTSLRLLRTAFVDEWQSRRAEVKIHAHQLLEQVSAATRQGTMHELMPIAGQSAGLVREILPAAMIVKQLVEEARTALRTVAPGRTNAGREARNLTKGLNL